MLEEEVFWIRMYSKASSIILELKLFKFEENLVNVEGRKWMACQAHYSWENLENRQLTISLWFHRDLNPF